MRSQHRGNQIVLDRFPGTAPDYEPIADDPVFDPSIHLALTRPEQTWSLTDFGYGEEIAGTTPAELAATSCFRILSDEGVAAMQHVCRQLEAFTRANPRIARTTRGGVYRSAFMRDFAMSVDVAEHVSALMQTPLHPHTMGHQLGHLNYQPLTLGENVDKWHYDTLQVDYVMFVTDPNTVEGGEVQYFFGTRDEMAQRVKSGQGIPADRIVAPAMPGAGYAVLMQGNYVVHQARGLDAPGERITLVNGYTFGDLSTPDYTALGQLLNADAASHATAEYTRHMAMRCAAHLEPCINQPDFEAEPAAQLARLQAAQQTLDEAVSQLQQAMDGPEAIRHFGD